jgi:hypothetical protein
LYRNLPSACVPLSGMPPSEEDEKAAEKMWQLHLNRETEYGQTNQPRETGRRKERQAQGQEGHQEAAQDGQEV